MKKKRFVRGSGGFTIVEIMVVVIIIGILATIVVANLAGRADEAKVVKAKQQIRHFETSLELYKIDNDVYPTTEEGLTALVEKPDSAKKWKKPYMKMIPKDPWGYDYIYVSNTDEDEYDVISYGRDGREGGTAFNADVALSTLGEEESE